MRQLSKKVPEQDSDHPPSSSQHLFCFFSFQFSPPPSFGPFPVFSQPPSKVQPSRALESAGLVQGAGGGVWG